MKRLTLLIALAAANMTAGAQTLLPARSEIGFTAKQMGVPVHGRFARYSAQIKFNPAKPEEATTTISIDLGSVAFGSPETEAEIAKADWFDVKRFSQAVFRSTTARPIGPGRLELVGDLTIKGATQQLTIPVDYSTTGEQSVAHGTFQLRRLDYGIGDRQWRDATLVANEVQVRFRFTLETVRK